MSLSGRVCLVTGASRGIGKGIALQLGENGATVYITGRTLKSNNESKGSLEDTAKQIEERGGVCIPVKCDHLKDDDIERLFKQIEQEQNGRLDLLVNNAYAAVNFLAENWGKMFYEQPLEAWDIINGVGLRNHYLCTVYAARLMVEQSHGLIIWISSVAGLRYVYNVPFGVGKAACDRMAADCAHELRTKNVACMSLWPGTVRTENVLDLMSDDQNREKGGELMKRAVAEGETTEYAGKAVVALLKEKDVMKRSGKIWLTSEIANQYGYLDINGKTPPHLRQISDILALTGYTWLAWLIPKWMRIPRWMLHMASNKF